MSQKTKELLESQANLASEISRYATNFGKDGESRKTLEYLGKRESAVSKLWAQFQKNHQEIEVIGLSSSQPYVQQEIFNTTKIVYKNLMGKIAVEREKFEQSINDDNGDDGASEENSDDSEPSKCSIIGSNDVVITEKVVTTNGKTIEVKKMLLCYNDFIEILEDCRECNTDESVGCVKWRIVNYARNIAMCNCRSTAMNRK